MISTDGFLIAGSNGPARTSAPPAPPPRQFLLEGTTDVFQVMPRTHRYGEVGPIPPSLGASLLPAVDALEQTTAQLKKHPTPQEADKSNIRRLIRVILTLGETHRNSYPDKKYDNSVKKLKKLAQAVGRFKDHGILEEEVATLYPDGQIPGKIQKKLDRSREEVETKFKEAFRTFRKEDLGYVVKTLSRPAPLDESGPLEVQQEDRRRISQRIRDLADGVDDVGLQNEEPREFHEGRKALRWLLLTTQSAREAFDFPEQDVEGMSRVVNGLGVAQDKFIAYDWLEQHGLDSEAAVKKQEYQVLHDRELQGAGEFWQSGALNRLREAVSNP